MAEIVPQFVRSYLGSFKKLHRNHTQMQQSKCQAVWIDHYEQIVKQGKELSFESCQDSLPLAVQILVASVLPTNQYKLEYFEEQFLPRIFGTSSDE